MKSKKEIEQLAEKKYPAEIWGEEKSMARRLAFEDGYTQCQEDMTNKKYTEEDMIVFAYQFSSINVADFRKHLKDFDINLKNKQD